jgi:hypothetical protein
VALLLASARYYGGRRAPNQQVSVVFAANGTYALYPTERLSSQLRRLLARLAEEGGGKAVGRAEAVRQQMGARIEATVNQALATTRFLTIRPAAAAKGNAERDEKEGAVKSGRLSRDTVYRIVAPRKVLADWERVVLGFRDESVGGIFPSRGGGDDREGEEVNDRGEEEGSDEEGETRRVEALRRRLAPLGATVGEKRFHLSLASVRPPEVHVEASVAGGGGGRVARDLPGGGDFVVRYPAGAFDRGEVEEAAARARRAVYDRLESSDGLYSKEAWREAVLGGGGGGGAATPAASFLGALAESLGKRANVSVNMRSIFHVAESDLSDVRFPDGEGGELCVPPWAMDADNPKMRLVADTAAALGYRLDFFPPDRLPVLRVSPVQRIDRELPFGLKRRPARIQGGAGFAKRPAKGDYAVMSFAYD